MQFTLAALALAATLVSATPQGVTSAISPSAAAPSGCATTYPGSFKIEIVNATTASSKKAKRQSDDTLLTMTLNNGILLDSQGRTGYIAANNQFQFDMPAQTGAIYTAGWSVCSNGSLTIGDDSIFYACLSGTFYNLYDQNTAAQCSQVYIDVIGSTASVSSAASQQGDGQPTGTVVSSAACVSQLSDGQPQVSGACSTSAAVTQITDGQIQASTVLTTSSSAVAPVTQISDGQIQAPTTTAKATTTTAGAVVSQATDGQIVATAKNGTIASATYTAVYTGAAVAMKEGVFGGLAAVGMAMALL